MSTLHSSSPKPQVQLEDFAAQLRNHNWSFMQQSFHAYKTARLAEEKLFYTALSNVALFREFQYQQARQIQTLVDSATANLREQHAKELAAARITGEEEFDLFRREVDAHDWWYERSDDGRVYRVGRDNHNRLEEVAKMRGGIFLKYWQHKSDEVNRRMTQGV